MTKKVASIRISTEQLHALIAERYKIPGVDMNNAQISSVSFSHWNHIIVVYYHGHGPSVEEDNSIPNLPLQERLPVHIKI